MPGSVLNAPAGFEWATQLADWRRDGDGLSVGAETSSGQRMALSFCAESPEIWRIRCLPPGGSFPEALPLVVGSVGPAVQLDLRETEAGLIASGPALTLEIGRDLWCVTFRDATGRVVCRENPFDVDGLGRSFVRPLGFVRDLGGAIVQMTESFHLRPDEHLFGLGEKFTPLDKTGQQIVSWTVDAFGSTSERSHKNVPLLISTRGYGLFLNTGRRITYELGTESCQSYTIVLDAPYLDAYLIYGPKPAEILERYTRLTGRASVPPKWSFGVWLSGSGVYRDEPAIQEMVAGLAEHDIPCDVIHVDPWWMRWRKYADFQWDRAAFPDPEKFIDSLHRQGLKLSLWQHPYISVESDLFEEGCRKGYFVRRPDGEAYVIDYGLSLAPRPADARPVEPGQNTWNARVAIVDLTNPAARAWYKALMRPVLEIGLDVFKTDFGEDIPSDAIFANGLTGAEMHNLYPLLYNQVVFEITEVVKGRGLVWSRAGYAGSQRYPTCWSGDPAADWDSLACTIRGGLSLGMSGIPFWSNDIGAYRGMPSERLYIRWAQFGLFCSHSRCHGESQREPWFYGQRAVEIFRRYALLRYQLFPYIYSCAHEAARTGLPMMRAMPLVFPDDPNCYDKDLQYLFGPWLLVAPIYDGGEQRNVYLPAGRWIDYWTGQSYRGPANIMVHAPLDVLPLYVRAGAILPQMLPARRIPSDPIEQLIVDVYPDGQTCYRLYEDESITDFTCTDDDAGSGLTFAWVSGVARPITLRIHDVGRPTRLDVRDHEHGAGVKNHWNVLPDDTVQVHVEGVHMAWLRMER